MSPLPDALRAPCCYCRSPSQQVLLLDGGSVSLSVLMSEANNLFLYVENLFFYLDKSLQKNKLFSVERVRSPAGGLSLPW